MADLTTLMVTIPMDTKLGIHTLLHIKHGTHIRHHMADLTTLTKPRIHTHHHTKDGTPTTPMPAPTPTEAMTPMAHPGTLTAGWIQTDPMMAALAIGL